MSNIYIEMKKAGVRENYIKKYNLRKLCSCGSSIIFKYNQDFKVCRHCGKLHYRNDSIAFRYTLSKLLK